MMSTAHVGHNCRVGDGVIMVNGSMLGGHVTVGERALISGNAGVHQFVRIGRLAMLGGTATATQDVPPFCVLRTGSLNRLSGLNSIGLRRSGLSAETRQALKRAFVKVFRSGMNLKEAAERMAQEQLLPEVAELIDFVRDSQRGVCSC
jgi:UDP-N-acetylglucosamine acyltransferase